MDKRQSPNLDELLNKIRGAQSSVSQKEIVDWIGSQEVLPLNKTRNNLKQITMITSSIIAVSLLIAGFWPVQKEGASIFRGQSQTETASPQLQSTVPLEAPHPLTASSPHHNSSSGSVAFVSPVDTPETDTLKRQIRVIKEIDVQDDGGMVIEEIYGPGNEVLPPVYSGPCQPVEGPLELPEEALKNLGIVSDAGTLLYYQPHTGKGGVRMMFDSLQLKNHQMTRSGSVSGPDIYPMLVANCGMHAVVDLDPEYRERAASWLAIKVPVEGSSRFYYFWFERNKEVLALLPEEVRTALNADKTLYSLSYTEPAPLKNVPQAGALSGEKISWEPEEQLVDIRPHLKTLGIEETPGGFDLNGRKGVRAEYGNESLRVDIEKGFKPKDQLVEKEVKKLVPFFITEDHFFSGLDAMVISLIPCSREASVEEVFAFEKYNLIGLKLQTESGRNFIFWYPYSPALKSLLTPEQQAMAEAKLAKIDKNILLQAERPVFKDVEEILVEEQPSIEALNSLTPDSSVLAKMGIRVMPDRSVALTQRMENGRYLTMGFGKEGVRIGDSETYDVSEEVKKNMVIINKALVFVTDDLGVKPRMSMGTEEELDMNHLIPVMVRSGLTYTLYDKINRRWRPDIIVWLKPTPEVLAILSEEGKGAEIGLVRSIEIPDTGFMENAECSYTELCRNKAAVFSEARIFPNPASGSSTFSWDSEEEALCEIRLYALNGKEVKAFVAIEASKGKNAYSMNLSGLSPGVYMVIMKGDKGDEIHQRLVIKE